MSKKWPFVVSSWPFVIFVFQQRTRKPVPQPSGAATLIG